MRGQPILVLLFIRRQHGIFPWSWHAERDNRPAHQLQQPTVLTVAFFGRGRLCYQLKNLLTETNYFLYI
jgi:hypothetical protein